MTSTRTLLAIVAVALGFLLVTGALAYQFTAALAAHEDLDNKQIQALQKQIHDDNALYQSKLDALNATNPLHGCFEISLDKLSDYSNVRYTILVVDDESLHQLMPFVCPKA